MKEEVIDFEFLLLLSSKRKEKKKKQTDLPVRYAIM